MSHTLAPQSTGLFTEWQTRFRHVESKRTAGGLCCIATGSHDPVLLYAGPDLSHSSWPVQLQLPALPRWLDRLFNVYVTCATN